MSSSETPRLGGSHRRRRQAPSPGSVSGGIMAKRFLVPLDRSPAAESVVTLVAGAARDTGGTVRLLHVAPVPRNVLTREGVVVAYADQEMARLEAEGLDYLRGVELGFRSDRPAPPRGSRPAQCADQGRRRRGIRGPGDGPSGSRGAGLSARGRAGVPI